MKRPIILEGEPFDWNAGAEAAGRIVNERGYINWKAAMAADPGVMRCPGCALWLWREGERVGCPECGEEFEP